MGSTNFPGFFPCFLFSLKFLNKLLCVFRTDYLKFSLFKRFFFFKQYIRLIQFI